MSTGIIYTLLENVSNSCKFVDKYFQYRWLTSTFWMYHTISYYCIYDCNIRNTFIIWVSSGRHLLSPVCVCSINIHAHAQCIQSWNGGPMKDEKIKDIWHFHDLWPWCVIFWSNINQCTHAPIIIDECLSWLIIALAATDWSLARVNHWL